jgi:tetratricopeptide (TPR) repeat protein
MGIVSSLLEELRRRHAAGEHTAAMRLAREILREPGGLAAADLFDVAKMGAGASMALREYFGAQRFVEKEVLYALATDDPDLVGTAHFHKGTVYMYIGSTGEALEAFTTFAAIDTPSRPALDRYRAGCWFNTGTAHMQRREYERAAGALAEARAVYAEQGDRHGVAECFLQEAWALMLADRYEPAAHQLGQASALLAEYPSNKLQLSCICHRAFYHYRQGEYDRAVALCEEIFQIDRPGVQHNHTSEAAWIAGECALVLGMLDHAEAMAAAATDHAVKAGWIWLMNRANELRQRVQAAREQTA